MRWVALALGLIASAATGCGDPTITDPCPGQRTCPDDVCCDVGFPYHCGGQCYQAPCGVDQVTCISVDRTDGCYGGKWEGTYSGQYRPTSGGMQSIGGAVTFDIFEHAITVTQPAVGTGSIDCDSGQGSWTSSGATPYMFGGTWMHTSSRGDQIMSATFSYTDAGGSGSGTWVALRVL